MKRFRILKGDRHFQESVRGQTWHGNGHFMALERLVIISKGANQIAHRDLDAFERILGKALKTTPMLDIPDGPAWKIGRTDGRAGADSYCRKVLGTEQTWIQERYYLCLRGMTIRAHETDWRKPIIAYNDKSKVVALIMAIQPGAVFLKQEDEA